jgi:hypothetical protein
VSFLFVSDIFPQLWIVIAVSGQTTFTEILWYQFLGLYVLGASGYSSRLPIFKSFCHEEGGGWVSVNQLGTSVVFFSLRRRISLSKF